MNKNFRKVAFLAALSLTAGTLQAQDTLWMKPAPLGSYFNNNWVDTTERYVAGVGGYVKSHIVARQFFTQDTLQIYGIATMMTNQFFPQFHPSSSYPNLQSYLYAHYPDDPSFDHCEESLMLFQYSEDDTVPMRQIGDSLPVHMLYTPVSYYMMSNTSPVCNWDSFPKPVYERYFSTPQTVYDTFYAGVTQSEGGYSKADRQWHDIRPLFWCISFGYPDQHWIDEVVAVFRQDSIDLPSEWHFYRDYIHNYWFIFPIIAPPDTTVNPGDTIVNPNDTIINPGDTIINPGDTLAIRTNDILYRYTALQPNPASDKVKVLSSFGISCIEAYDLKGRKVSEFRTPNSEFSITLDVSSWPRGTYLLRITTPAGQTTKKLLLR